MKITDTLYVSNRDEWRAWLEQHHADTGEIWLIFPKAHTGTPRIPYADAVEEALCFGWIDSNMKPIDENQSAQRFTPRRAKSKWSELNKERVRKLIAEGKMTEAGLALLPDLSAPPAPPPEPIPLPPDLEAALKATPNAWENYNRFTERYQQLSLRWITAAKKEETRLRRVQEFVELTARNEKLGMK